jgi:hypothetical protein
MYQSNGFDPATLAFATAVKRLGESLLNAFRMQEISA